MTKKKKDTKPKENGEAKKNDVVVLSTPVFRLKDDPPEKAIQFISLKRQFGTIPDVIAVEKVKGQNNRLIVRAFVPPETVKPQIEVGTIKPMLEIKISIPIWIIKKLGQWGLIDRCGQCGGEMTPQGYYDERSYCRKC